jgi:Na+-transporting methylmalonyl-CoA/oxaloacetate decarboxylase gamma subunit
MSGWDNVVANNGVAIAIVGMVIVFAVLLLIAGCIGMFPRVLRVVARYLPEQKPAHSRHPAEDGAEAERTVAVAIAVAMRRQRQLRQSAP